MLARLDALEAELVGGRRRRIDASSLQPLVALLDRQFATHMAAEDEVLYPALADAFPESRLTLDPLRLDHAELRGMLSELARRLAEPAGTARDEQLVVLVRDFVDLLRIHIRKEEAVVFDIAPRVLGPAGVARLGTRLARYRVPVRPGAERRQKGNLS